MNIAPIETYWPWLLIALAAYYLLGAVAIRVVLRSCGVIGFEDRYRPMSDKEFLRRCHPGVNPSIALRVRRIVANQTGAPPEYIHPEMTFLDLEF